MTASEQSPAAVRIARTLAASPAEVYRAWLDADVLARWLAPGNMEVTRVEVDERVGGHYRIWQASAGGTAGGFECEILELVPNERIVFRWGFVGPERTFGPTYDSLLSITLTETPGGGTHLTLVHEQLDELRTAMPDVADSVAAGWSLVLDKLAATVAART